MLIHIIAFCRWAFVNGYKEGLHLDRIDNDLGYSSKNRRFGRGWSVKMALTLPVDQFKQRMRRGVFALAHRKHFLAIVRSVGEGFF